MAPRLQAVRLVQTSQLRLRRRSFGYARSGMERSRRPMPSSGSSRRPGSTGRPSACPSNSGCPYYSRTPSAVISRRTSLTIPICVR